MSDQPCSLTSLNRQLLTLDGLCIIDSANEEQQVAATLIQIQLSNNEKYMSNYTPSVSIVNTTSDGNRESDEEKSTGVPTNQQSVALSESICEKMNEYYEFQTELSTGIILMSDALLSVVIINNNEQNLIESLDIQDQPSVYQHKRSAREIEKGAAYIQGVSKQNGNKKTQRNPKTLIKEEWRQMYDAQLYMQVQLCKFNGEKHPYPLCPPQVKIDQYSHEINQKIQNTKNRQIPINIENHDEVYCAETNSILYPITDSDFKCQSKRYASVY
ncbi:unnamed protein product [Didymodactylos carnosus]|uniref:Uncharacterized protein n=1 Tax=Didymodactylos carnosus TaxID=1234261 RepID=A0A814XP29_9BILA|nr:unnamed protein product [Didymodactylos carnosus]CAF3978797.1 unnamed protein product [Didymodactylos carnosus]